MTPSIVDNEPMSLQKALNEIHFYRGVAPVKAYEFLVDNQQEATPYLIRLLKNTIRHHGHTGNYYVAHIHALLLLGQFREKTAYPLVIELLNLPIESIDRLMGDMLTETLPKIMTSLYDGNPEPLFALLINHEGDATLRSVIGGCFTALIYQQLIDREFVLLRLQENVASGKMNQDQAFYSTLASLTLDCKLEPLYDTVRAAFKTGLVSEYLMSIHYFDQNLSRPIEELVREEDLHPLSSAIKEIAKWHAYSNDKPIPVKIERNAPCPCGSGDKFKNCCIEKQ